MRLAFLHTVPALVEMFNRLVEELLPSDVDVIHIADELLLRIVLDKGGLSPFIHRRVAEHVFAAEQARVGVVQLTCSSISPCVDLAKHLVQIPILKIDEPMIDAAIDIGVRIGIAATAPTTLKPTTELIHTRAEVVNKEVQVESSLCEGAYKSLLSGDIETHDRIVHQTLLELMSHNDVVLLAQATMARVADTIPEEDRLVPILSSPRLAMDRLKQVLD